MAVECRFEQRPTKKDKNGKILNDQRTAFAEDNISSISQTSPIKTFWPHRAEQIRFKVFLLEPS